MAESDSLIKELKQKKRLLKGKLTRIINNTKEITDIELIKIYLEQANPLLKEFQECLEKLSRYIDITDQDEEELTEFELKYINLICAMQKMLISPTSSSNESNITNQISSHSKIMLPPINLPTFSGSYKEWISFRDLYVSLVHDRIDLPNIQKLHYLKSSLINDAAKVIESISLTADNYLVAWNLLKKKYERTRFIIENHIRSFINLMQITKSSIFGCVDEIQKTVRSLEALNHAPNANDTLLLQLLLSKTDKNLKEEWQEFSLDIELPTIEDFLKFLNKKCTIFESTQDMVNTDKPKISTKRHSYLQTNKTNKCIICNQSNHLIYHCKKLLSMNIRERISAIRQAKLCLNCLKEGHQANNCSLGSCKKCDKKHNTLLHLENQRNVATEAKTVESTEETDKSGAYTCLQDCGKTIVLLSTAVIELKSRDNKWLKAKAILDTGSQLNFVTEDFAKKLKLKENDTNVTIVGVNNAENNVNKSITTEFQSTDSKFKHSLEFNILPRITQNTPTNTLSRDQIDIPSNIKLADPTFHRSSKIDILIGADIFYNLLCIGQIRNQNGLTLQKTRLGWIIAGRYTPTKATQKLSLCNLALNAEQTLNKMLTKFWEIENGDEKNYLNKDDTFCEKHFEESYTRNNEGRFIVKLPIKSEIQLGDSYHSAEKRFKSLENKLDKNPLVKKQYDDFMKEYVQLGHMKEIQDNDNSNIVYYMPHHCVINEHSATTKLRVVFDGSAKSSNNRSLNDFLLPGPKLQDNLFFTLLRFRTYKYVISADISKMFRQILIHEDFKPLHRILYRFSKEENIKTFELQTVTYGTTSATYIAVKCIQELAKLERNKYPVAAKTIINDFYVDDMLTGANTINEIEIIKEQVPKLLKQGGFTLHKWSSNCDNQIGINKEQDTLNFNKDATVKTLGLQWNTLTDRLQYSIPNSTVEIKITKRKIISHVCQVFDPLGCISPVTVTAKILIQKLWALKLDWDESIPNELHTNWQNYQKELDYLKQIEIPRNVIRQLPINIQLHGFCDASKDAYGACLYIRIKNKEFQFESQLLCAKSRVAPLKSLTIPKLELCGALLLANLATDITNNMNIRFSNIFYWTDSSIVLHWIRSCSKDYKQFVSNRIGQIQSNTNPHQWQHVPTNDNPADLISRGLAPKQLVDNKLWWTGPSWLSRSQHYWPLNKLNIYDIEIPEKRINLLTTTTNSTWNVYDKFSNLHKLVRVVAYCRRFISNCRLLKENRVINRTIDAIEYASSLKILIKAAQRHSFAREIHDLNKNNSFKKCSQLSNLDPFIDDEGLVRVGGRLRKSMLNFEQKHQVILPADHTLTKLIIINVHNETFHAGQLATLYELRNRYWPLKAKSIIKRIINNCIICIKHKPNLIKRKLGDLPIERVQITPPFFNCGIDYCGPFTIKSIAPRSKINFKAYLALFVCFSTKAVHIEVVSNLTSEAFISALKRFLARRGPVQNMYSDNASTFVGANRELKGLHTFLKTSTTTDAIVTELAHKEIKWHFIPARSPHFGGLWEDAIKSLKYHLKRITNTTKYTYEELNTVAIRIEAILNSRPLTTINSYPNDPSPLTPGHFLTGSLLATVPEMDLRNVSDNRLARWELMQKQTQHLWHKWKNSYLNELQQRYKDKASDRQSLQVGDVVIIKEDNLAVNKWPLGRITAVHPGSDGKVRVVTLKTKENITKRAAKNLCKLSIGKQVEIQSAQE